MIFKKRERPPPPIVHAGDDDFESVIADRPGVAVVDFWAPWCAPCRMMEPILAEIAIEHEKRGVRVIKVNADDAPKLSVMYGIRSIPTLIFFRDGEPEFEMVGLVPKPVLEREIADLLARSG